MGTDILTLLGFAIATSAIFIPGVRSTRPDVNASLIEKVKFYAKKHKKLIGVAGGILGAFATYRASGEQDKAQATIVQKSDTIANLNRLLLNRQIRSDVSSIKQYKKLLDQAIGQQNQTALLLEEEKKLRKKTEEIARLNNELKAKSFEITDLSKKGLNVITGGDSFCYLIIFPIEANTAKVILVHMGKYPVYDLKITGKAMRPDKFTHSNDSPRQITYQELKEYNKPDFEFKVGTSAGEVNPSKENGQLTVDLGDINYDPNFMNYRIQFLARNGFWHQQFKLALSSNGSITSANRVLRGVSFVEDLPRGKIIYEEINPYFPREADGSINWK